MSTIHILVGEGIECEKESERFFGQYLGRKTARVRIPDLLDGSSDGVSAGDWVFIPGGFSFADHFGSGRLLAFELKKAGFLERCVEKGVHLMGVCNGFQVLMETGLFGAGVSLEHNELGGHGLGFINRWVECRGEGPLEGEQFFIPVRHGEGRIQRRAASWEAGVQPFLRYADARFDNGSFEKVAGLQARRGKSCVVGMMPHPEIAARLLDGPDAVGPEWPYERQSDQKLKLESPSSDGVKLMQRIFAWAEGG